MQLDAALPGFIVAALVVLVLPGPGVMYVVTRSVSQGYRAGLASVLGLSLGALFHVVAATIGLSTILMTSADAFSIVKLTGALYLIYLGLRTILGNDRMPVADAPPALDTRRIVTDGVIVSVFNPKIAVFFLAFLPQFADPAQGSVAAQVFLLGLIYVGIAFITDGAYAILAGSARRLLKSRVIKSRWPNTISGGVYIGLGVTTALTERR